MGYWVNTAYLNHVSTADVVSALEKSFAAEGMQRVSLPPRERLSIEPMQYDRALNNDLWGVAVFPEVTPGPSFRQHPSSCWLNAWRGRIAGASSACAANCAAPPCWSMSTTRRASYWPSVRWIGEVFVCGHNGQTGMNDPYRLHNESVDEQSYRLRLRVHASRVSDIEDEWGEGFAARIAKECGGVNAAYCDNLVSVDTLISRKPFSAPGGQALYFKWTGDSRQRYEPCSSWAEYQAMNGSARGNESFAFLTSVDQAERIVHDNCESRRYRRHHSRSRPRPDTQAARMRTESPSNALPCANL